MEAKASAEAKPAKKKSKLYDIWRQLKKNKLAVASLIILIAIILLAIFGPFFMKYSYEEQGSDRYAAPSAEHVLGTDKLGRDTLSRLLYGARASLRMGFISVAFSAVIGCLIGAFAGYYGRWVDNLVMRLLDVYQAIPMMLLCIILAAILGPSLQNAIFALGISGVPGYARLMRASVLSVRENEYIEAAKAIGLSNAVIILRHVIPNALAPAIVQVTMGIGSMILAGSALSFIGLGAQPPLPEWGCMIADARNVMRAHPEQAIYPGIFIMLTVLSTNLLGDGLRDALDPRLRR